MRRVALVAVAVLAAVGPWVTTPTAASAAPCATSSVSSSVSVALVVDLGDGRAVSADCVPADSTASGLDVLTARHDVRFAPSGLVCGIDGVPSDGCGEQSGSRYAYWAYFRAPAGSWVYQSTGPASVRVKSTTVEGWRFQPDGAGNPTDPPPRGSPDPAATCAPEEPTISTTTTTTTTSTSTGRGTPTTASTASAAPTTESSDSTEPSKSSTSAGAAPASASGTAAPAAPSGNVRVREAGSGSSVWPAVGAGTAIAGLGAAGIVISRRRARAGP